MKAFFIIILLTGCSKDLMIHEYAGHKIEVSRSAFGVNLDVGHFKINVGKDCKATVELEKARSVQTEAIEAAVEGAVKGASKAVIP